MRRVLAATVFLAPFSHAAEEANKPAAKAQPVMLQAFTAAIQEMKQAIDDDAHPNTNFEKLMNFQHSPETVKLLVEAFGTERPWGLEKGGVVDGKTVWHSPLFALRRTTPSGGTVEWSELTTDVLVAADGKTMEFRAAWPSFSYEDKDARFTLRDGALTGTQRRGGGKLWYGNVQGSLASVQVEGVKQPFSMSMRDLRLTTRMDERARTVEMTQKFGIKAIEFAGERIDDFTLDVRIANIEKAALVAAQAADKKLSAKQAASREDLSALMPLLKSFVRGAAKHKTALVIDEMSLAFHGHKAMLKGRVGLDAVKDADLADMSKVAKRINGRFEIRVPVALVREVALAVARKQAAAANKPQAQPQDLAAAAQSITDVIIGKALGNGFARLENDVLVSTIEFRGGVLRVNGKKIDLPKPARAPVPAAAANYMQSRRVTDSCTLPDYPAEVVEKDAALAVTLEYVVDPEGQLRAVHLAQPSGFSAFDGALLQAFKACRFIPALKDGKPVEQTVTQTFRREPGSVRP